MFSSAVNQRRAPMFPSGAMIQRTFMILELKVLAMAVAVLMVSGQSPGASAPTDDRDVATLLAGMDEATMNRRSVRTVLFGLHRASDRDFSQQEPCMMENLRVVGDTKNPECFYVCLGLPGGLARKGCCAPGSRYLAPNATNVLGDCTAPPEYALPVFPSSAILMEPPGTRNMSVCSYIAGPLGDIRGSRIAVGGQAGIVRFLKTCISEKVSGVRILPHPCRDTISFLPTLCHSV
eukprot:jgi/Botrbrau1/16630/Bobra.0068s0049.1